MQRNLIFSVPVCNWIYGEDSFISRHLMGQWLARWSINLQDYYRPKTFEEYLNAPTITFWQQDQVTAQDMANAILKSLPMLRHYWIYVPNTDAFDHPGPHFVPWPNKHCIRTGPFSSPFPALEIQRLESFIDARTHCLGRWTLMANQFDRDIDFVLF